MITIRRAVAADAAAARDVRLRALTDAPGAFATTLAREEAVPDDGWVERVTTAAWFLAWSPAGVVGVAVGIDDPDDADARHLVGMWVEPAHRGDGTAARLVEAVLGWARGDGARAVALWVVDGNERARRFYARLGFRATGERGPLPSDPAVLESRLRRAI
ncbi:GNAT family N-acetyltransferase [Actinomycetospora soli]|uniref:GNAT family N-acetyltransferase n=1 Tax=Actinomycetospora soli TaxID=2893887 RepID=UPI001E4E423F|nr:GNAT family N-acetyltransferase [Actinomycetospora soli]MCD2188936.1 GNAT family N-acetyltransferase [Actinomycetospora soli]